MNPTEEQQLERLVDALRGIEASVDNLKMVIEARTRMNTILLDALHETECFCANDGEFDPCIRCKAIADCHAIAEEFGSMEVAT